MLCSDVEKFVHPYLDGEFAESDRVEMERHIAGCATCRDLVTFQASFKANLRARLSRPVVPAGLRARVVVALDRAEAQGIGRGARRYRRVVPIGAAAAAAAVAIVFVGSSLRSHADSPIVEEAIRSHEKNLPPEVLGSEDSVNAWMHGKVGVPVKPPHLRARGAALVGARVGHLSSRDAAQLVYKVGRSNLTVHVFDPSGLPLTGPQTRRVGTREVYVDQRRGYNVVYYRDRGIGYAFTSDLDADEMIRLVSTSLSD